MQRDTRRVVGVSGIKVSRLRSAMTIGNVGRKVMEALVKALSNILLLSDFLSSGGVNSMGL